MSGRLYLGTDLTLGDDFIQAAIHACFGTNSGGGRPVLLFCSGNVSAKTDASSWQAWYGA